MRTANDAVRWVLAVGFVVTCVVSALGQSDKPSGPSYEVSLQFVMGTSDGGKSELPANLSAIGKELKNNFGTADYRVAGMLLGRVGHNGKYEYRSVSNIFGMENASATPTFLEWTITEARGAASDKGRNFEGSTFRFGARVPILGARDEAGKPSVNYEQVGVNAQRFSFAENTPTLIGTLSLPNTPGTVFLVVTARATE